jgi:hypothetical protein
MARPENVQIEEPAEKVIPIADPEAETIGSPGSVTKRPFVLDKKRGSGGGNMPLMLMVLGAIIIFCIGMLAFLSSKGTTKKKTAAEAAKPNLGRITGTTAPGDLIPSDKVKPSPDEVKKGGTVDAADIEKAKAPKVTQAQDPNKQSAPNGNKQLNQVGKFEEPDTTPNGQPKWTPPPYSGGQSEQQVLKREEDALSKPSLVFTAHNQSSAGLRSATQSEQQRVINLGLAPGYHVAARLESMATTAVHAPVTAVSSFRNCCTPPLAVLTYPAMFGESVPFRDASEAGCTEIGEVLYLKKAVVIRTCRFKSAQQIHPNWTSRQVVVRPYRTGRVLRLSSQ